MQLFVNTQLFIGLSKYNITNISYFTSVCPSVSPAVVSQNVTYKNCFVCVESEKYAFWRLRCSMVWPHFYIVLHPSEVSTFAS